jgi:hypothetical protein
MTKLSKKQLIIGILTLVLSLGLVACGKKPVPAANTNQDVNQAVNQDVNTNIATTTAATSTAEMDTSNWKTYRNEEYGFEFKYPEEWSFIAFNKGEPELDPTPLLLLVEFYDSEYRSRFYVGIDKIENQKLYDYLNNKNFSSSNILVQDNIVTKFENQTIIQSLFRSDRYLINLQGVKPLENKIMDDIIFTFKLR